MKAEEDLWDINEVARYLKVSRETLYRWITANQMPAPQV